MVILPRDVYKHRESQLLCSEPTWGSREWLPPARCLLSVPIEVHGRTGVITKHKNNSFTLCKPNIWTRFKFYFTKLRNPWVQGNIFPLLRKKCSLDSHIDEGSSHSPLQIFKWNSYNRYVKFSDLVRVYNFGNTACQ